MPNEIPITLFKNYKKIIEFVKSKGAIPVINLLIYLSPKVGDKYPIRKEYIKINKQITILNNLINDYGIKNKIDIIDLNQIVSDKNNLLKKNTLQMVYT